MCKKYGLRKFGSTGVRNYGSTEVQKYGSTEVPENGSTEVLKYGCTDQDIHIANLPLNVKRIRVKFRVKSAAWCITYSLNAVTRLFCTISTIDTYS